MTLDTKILSALSRVAKGDLARQIINYRESEASANRAVRGRQVLLMFEHYFKTNEEAGSLYSIEDLLKVQLCGDDLSTFNRNWESVIAGLNHQPEETTLRDILLRQLRNASKLKFDLEVYDRAKEGSEQHTYDYLVKCVKEFWIGLVRIEQPLKKLTEQSSEPQHFPNRTLPAKGAKKPR